MRVELPPVNPATDRREGRGFAQGSSHGETYTDDGAAGAALWATPSADPLSGDPRYAERLEEIAGIDAPRLFAVVELLEANTPQRPHYHLQFLGVRPERQGGGT